MLKKLTLIFLLFSLLVPSTFAASGSGACAGHDGVSCTAGPDYW